MNENRREEQTKEEEKTRFLDGLKRYPEKGVPVYIDDKIPGPEDWEKLVQIREDNRFYMGDYIQTETGCLKEIRFDQVYLGGLSETEKSRKKYGAGRRSEAD